MLFPNTCSDGEVSGFIIDIAECEEILMVSLYEIIFIEREFFFFFYKEV